LTRPTATNSAVGVPCLPCGEFPPDAVAPAVESFLNMAKFKVICEICNKPFDDYQAAERCEAKHADRRDEMNALTEGERLKSGTIFSHQARFFELLEAAPVRVIRCSKDRPMEMGAVTFGNVRNANLRELKEDERDLVELTPEFLALMASKAVGTLAQHVAVEAKVDKVESSCASVAVYLDLLAAKYGFDLGESVRQHFLRKKPLNEKKRTA
jgi:hypothetical protein